jgi:hypothetical protein
MFAEESARLTNAPTNVPAGEELPAVAINETRTGDITVMTTKTNHGLSDQQVKGIEAEARQLGVIAQYRAMLRRGESPRMAIMLLAQRFPGLKGTDTGFQKLERQRVNHEYTSQDMAKIHQLAKAAGIPTAGKTYNGQLGRYTDPHAWVSDTSDVRMAAKAKGLSLRGHITVEHETKPVAKKKLSNRLVRETERAYLEASPKLAEKCRKKPSARRELRERIIEKHGSR